MASPTISIVVPFYNEKDNVEKLWERLKETLDSFAQPYEVIFVDDGSTDGTREILRELAKSNKEIKVIFFRTNFGQSAAMSAGFRFTKGKIVFAMDGDLQNDPGDIPLLVKKLNEGYDAVSGWRKDRQDKLISRKIPSKIANRIICSVTDVKLHDTGCSLKAFRGDLLRRIALYGEFHRFIPALLRMEGAHIAELPVKHHARLFGQSKYNISRTFRVIMDLITIRLLMKHLYNPLGFFAPFSVLCALGGLLTFAQSIYFIITQPDYVDAFNVLITMTVLLWASAFMFFSLGLLAKLIVKNGERKSFSLDLP